MSHSILSAVGGELAGALHGWDLAVVVVAVAIMMVIAFVAGRKEHDTRDFFLGGRGVPMAVAALSLVATEVSALTVTNLPGTTAVSDLRYLQFFIGSAASKVFVAFLFLPVFYRHDCTSIYEFLRHRFGPGSQIAGSAFFLLTRLLASGVRLLAACTAISVIAGWDLAATLMLFTAAAILFIGFGGVKAVVWSGAYQATIFFLAGGAAMVWLLMHVDGGAAQAVQAAWQAGRLRLFDFAPGLADPMSFWGGSANAFFVGLAIFGADQELVQRLLTVRTRSASQRAILVSIGAALAVTLLFSLLGTALFAFLNQAEPAALALEAKKIFPHAIEAYLPTGMKGLMLAAIVLASIDLPLSSLSSSFMADLYQPLIAPGRSQRHYLWMSRVGVAGAAGLLVAVAWAGRDVANLLWLGFEIISITGGSLLGVFLLGLLTRRGRCVTNIIAMIVNAVAMTAMDLACKMGPVAMKRFLGLSQEPLPPDETPILPIGWTWVIVAGTVLTFAMAYALDVISSWASSCRRNRSGSPSR